MLRKIFFNLAYYQKPIWDTGISPPELMSFISVHNPGRALELGCGSGTNLITLAKAGWHVIGVDFAIHALRITEKKATQNNLKLDLRWQDVTRLNNIYGCFDLILDIGCFHSLPPRDHDRYITNIDKYLSPTGTYLLYVFLKDQAGNFGPGVTEEMISAFSTKLKIAGRTDSTERGIRPSAWLWIRKRKKTDH